MGRLDVKLMVTHVRFLLMWHAFFVEQAILAPRKLVIALSCDASFQAVVAEKVMDLVVALPIQSYSCDKFARTL